MKKLGSTCFASIWELLWRNPKGFLILTTFRGCTLHKSFPFCGFSLSPSLCLAKWGLGENVEKVKTKTTCAPPKTYQNKKSFWIPSKQAPNTCRVGIFIPMFMTGILMITVHSSQYALHNNLGEPLDEKDYMGAILV